MKSITKFVCNICSVEILYVKSKMELISGRKVLGNCQSNYKAEKLKGDVVNKKV